jgi:hypothetical protein
MAETVQASKGISELMSFWRPLRSAAKAPGTRASSQRPVTGPVTVPVTGSVIGTGPFGARLWKWKKLGKAGELRNRNWLKIGAWFRARSVRSPKKAAGRKAWRKRPLLVFMIERARPETR